MFEDTTHIREFEFYYLAELTRQRIKPLSRWEKPLNRKVHRWLKKRGFAVEFVPRKLLNGNKIHETVFSISTRYTEMYQKKFAHTLLGQNASDQKDEGFLFGYPSCCVHQYIEHPYISNNLKKSEQAKLFHWACPKCRSTVELIPYYSKAFNHTKEWHEQHAHLYQSKVRAGQSHQKWRIPAALTTMFLSAGFLSAQSAVDSSHFIPLEEDVNLNNLSYAEELCLGHFNMASLTESQATAKSMAQFIEALPTEPFVAEPIYREDHMFRGVIQCLKCDSLINMGFARIINTQRQLQIDLPYMALHFMHHGSFSHGNDDGFQRVDIDTLKRVIAPYDKAHLLPVNGDSDSDGLTDAEEESLSINYTSDNPDCDGDGVADGAQLAEELIRLFPKLKEESDDIHSHVQFNLVWGLENCQVCGSTHNMGTVTITNPENKRSCEIPVMALHSMAHGSFAYNGTVHENDRTKVIDLVRSIKTHMQYIQDDADDDGLRDGEEEKFGYDPNLADSNNDGTCDGKELALKFVNSIKSLPTEPRLDGPYLQYLGMDGIHLCSVCGEEIVMGVYQIYNPLINTPEPLEIREYALHFMEHGSFSYQGALEGRIDPDALANYLDVVTNIDHKIIPETFDLKQNFPNPFNHVTTIEYKIPTASWVELSIYNIQGQKVAELLSKKQNAGIYKVVWDAGGFTSGVYLYELITDKGYKSAKKLILLK